MRTESTESEVTTIEEMEMIEYDSEESTTELATPSSATHTIEFTDEEFNTFIGVISSMYNLLVFWFILWATLKSLSMIRSQYLKGTKGVKD